MNNNYNGIWIYAELHNGEISDPVYELLGKACELKAHNAEDITAVLLGCDVEKLTSDLIRHGADKVVVIDNPALKEYSARPYADALTQVINKYMPSIVLYPATSQGRDLAPRLMVSLNTGLTADAIDLGFDKDGDFYQTTPAYSGKLLAHIVISEKRPQMATVHPGIFSPIEADDSRVGEVILEQVCVEEDADYSVVSRTVKPAQADSVEKAKVVISGGRGVKEPDDFEQLKKLASLLGGSVACSRPIVDKSWLDHSRQLGQSGASIRPDLLINFAISGSVQYSVGIQNAKTIISINQDKYAPIFDMSHFGAVSDYKQVMEELIRQLEK